MELGEFLGEAHDRVLELESNLLSFLLKSGTTSVFIFYYCTGIIRQQEVIIKVSLYNLDCNFSYKWQEASLWSDMLRATIIR
jgi:hypothetical protein